MKTGEIISHYRILEPLGAGGMGEVYRASDSRLGRDVALKVLPEAFAKDQARMARFQREAQVLASLNHPNIAAIYGLEESDNTRALVMELVEGATLAERLAAGPIPLDETLLVAKQIAEALEYAHEHGIVHRDLKPANVKITPAGTVKLLDFGLAKALEESPAAADISTSPTLTLAATQAGIILGTAAYMSPEQARGKTADRRADVWSFGIVLFEMLTGKQAFRGETVSDTLAAVIMKEPDFAAVPAKTPARVERLLRRCLEKDAKRRLQAIGEARIAIENQISGVVDAEGAGAAQTGSTTAGRREMVPWILSGALAVTAVAALAGFWRASRPALKPITRFSLELPATQALQLGNDPALALSADGSQLVYALTVEGKPQLFLRSLDRLEAALIPGTEGGSGPFFSPDGKSVGFFADGKMKKVSVSGGTVTIVDDLGGSRGAAWGPDDTIVYAQSATSGLMRIRTAGSVPQPLTTLDRSKKERTHRWPQFLPGGKVVLFTVGALDSPDYYEDARIEAVVLATGERKELFRGASMARYVSSGHLLLTRESVLYAVPFDPDSLKMTGTPIPVLDGVNSELTTGAMHFSVADNGTIAFIPGETQGTKFLLGWTDRSGMFRPLPVPARTFRDPRLSPDGKRLAMVISESKDEDIWVYDFERGTLSRLTFGLPHRGPIWSPDGKRIAYSTPVGDGKSNDVRWKAADGSGDEERIARFDNRVYADSWSSDGKQLICSKLNDRGLREIWSVPLEGDRTPKRKTQSAFEEWGPATSPDRRWLAYTSVESGLPQIYVRPFDESAGKWQVSTDGGLEPRWSSTGGELFYRSLRDNRIIAVAIETGASFRAGIPRILFEGIYSVRTETDTLYDVSPDAKRFLTIRPAAGDIHSRQIDLVLNWSERLRGPLSESQK